MKRREMKLLLEERFERIALLETRIDTMDQLVEGYRAREQAILDTLQSAKDTAARTLEQANAEAAKIRATVTAEAESIRAAADTEANAKVTDAAAASDALRLEAERRAKEIMITAKAESDRMLRDAEIMKREYEEMVDLFNAMLEHNASELQSSAVRFAEFMKSSKIDTLENRNDGEVFYKSVGALKDVSLPDPSGDPATLMQNIYRIQNRPLPDEKAEHTAEENIEETQQTAAEPFSEAAWANEAQESSTEPQAEFTKVFDNAYSESAFVVRADGCHLSQEQAEHMFDALFTAQDFSADTEEAQNAPEATAVKSASTQSEQTQEVDRAFEELFGDKADSEIEHEEATKTQDDQTIQTQAEPEQAQPAEDENAADEDSVQPMEDNQNEENVLNTESETSEETEESAQEEPTEYHVYSMPVETVSEQYNPTEQIEQTEQTEQIEQTEPEPYSEAAWTYESFTSDTEPQAEFTPAFSAESVTEEQTEQQGASEIDAERAFDEFIRSSGVEPTLAEEETLAELAQYATSSDKQDSGETMAETQTEVYSSLGGAAVTAQTAQAKGIFDADAGLAFDDFMKSNQEDENAGQPAPYSEAAWAREAFMSSHEPQAEGNMFSGETDSANGQETSQKSMNDDTASTIDDILSGYTALVSSEEEKPQAAQTQTEMVQQPEFDSDSSWNRNSFMSETEPQAQSAMYSVAEPEETEEPEEEEEPAPVRHYSDYGVEREWEPEPEPDMGDLPTVSRYVGESRAEDEISLDDLLEEIIKAGE